MDRFITKTKRERPEADGGGAPVETPESKALRAADPVTAGPSTEPTCQPEALPELAMLEHLDATSSWREALRKEFGKGYMRELDAKLTRERQSKTVFPRPEDVFAALNFTPLQDVRVVILGQDPYHGVGQVSRPSPQSACAAHICRPRSLVCLCLAITLHLPGARLLLQRAARRHTAAEPEEHLQRARD
jgi:hypothetical protein